MTSINFVLGGLGGQGILFMTKILARTALEKGYRVMGAETHGMAQRGGSVVSHLRLGDAKGSLVRSGTARFLLALEENEAYRNIPFLARGGRLYANAMSDSFPRPEVRDFLNTIEVVWRALPAGDLAMDLGAPMSSNLALLGFFSGFGESPLTYEDLRATVDAVSPERLKEINLKVFDAGYRQASTPNKTP
jgi:indolepyruvate ferredoxin oxidoreductase beta subunit